VYAGEVIVLFVVAALVALPWLAIRDVRRHPVQRWERAGHSRAAWIAVIVLVPVLGGALYLRRVRPRLRADELG
jgi:hypothetical protein